RYIWCRNLRAAGRCLWAGAPRSARRPARIRCWRDERAAVQARDVRDGPQNLLRLHVAQVNARDAVVRVVVDEEPAPVVIAFGLAERRVMHVAPRVTAEHLLRFVIKAVARGRVWRIDGDG